MKKYSMLVFVIVLIFALVGCGGGKESASPSSSEGPKAKNIAILTPYLSSVTTNEMVEELKKQAEQYGWETNVVDTKGDVGQMASRMEDVISKKVDAIVIVSTDPNQLKAQIKSASDKGIPVFGCDAAYIEGMKSNATSDNAAMSKLITEFLIEKIGKKGNVVVLTHRPHPGVLKRSETLDEMLKQNPDIKVVTEQHVEVPGPLENSRKQMENLLLSNKEEGSITAVWAGWDEPAIGAAQAIEAAGRKDIIVTGIDGTSQAIDLIKKDSPLAATVKQNFVGMAQITAKQIDLVLQGKDVEGTELYAPATLITKENASK